MGSYHLAWLSFNIIDNIFTKEQEKKNLSRFLCSTFLDKNTYKNAFEIQSDQIYVCIYIVQNVNLKY